MFSFTLFRLPIGRALASCSMKSLLKTDLNSETEFFPLFAFIRFSLFKNGTQFYQVSSFFACMQSHRWIYIHNLSSPPRHKWNVIGLECNFIILLFIIEARKSKQCFLFLLNPRFKSCCAKLTILHMTHILMIGWKVRGESERRKCLSRARTKEKNSSDRRDIYVTSFELRERSA